MAPKLNGSVSSKVRQVEASPVGFVETRTLAELSLRSPAVPPPTCLSATATQRVVVGQETPTR
jgi:hypothetical protein